MADTSANAVAQKAMTLGSLCDEAAFVRLVDTIAAGIADRFVLKMHKNIVARRMAFTTWIDHLTGNEPRDTDYRSFIAVCAALIESLATRPSVGYSAMVRDPGDRMIDAVLKFPNEVTALMTGAALYDAYVTALTGRPAAEPLEALVLENAAANLARNPEATAARFREVLRLSTPWG